MARKLKVYRTPIGFHDAFVAAPSQKAALEAWGANANLFARGVAEEVTDPTLTAEPLAEPGKVIRRIRGTAAEHMAALPPNLEPSKRKTGNAQASASERVRSVPRPKPKPRPSREALDAAETSLEEAERQHARAAQRIAEREAEIAKERQELERDYRRKVKQLEGVRAEAQSEYERLLTEWQEQ